MLFEPVRHREFKAEPFAGADRLRVLEDLRVHAVGSIKTDIGPGPLVAFRIGVNRILVRPLVVGLPGVIAALKQNIGGAIVADNEDDVTLPITMSARVRKRRQPTDVNAARPVTGNVERDATFPFALAQSFRTVLGRRLSRSRQRPNGFSSALRRGRRSSRCERSRS